MDWLTFWATVITAWPLAVVALAFIFGKEIRSLLNRIRSAKAGGAELLFEQGVNDAEILKALERLAPKAEPPAKPEAPKLPAPKPPAPKPADEAPAAEEGTETPAREPAPGAPLFSLKRLPKYPFQAQDLKALAVDNARGAIVLAWIGVEEALWRAAEARGYQGPRTSVMAAFDFLYERSFTSKEQLEEFRKLRQLRNLAVHDKDFNPSFESVEKFLLLAEDMQSGFQQLSRTSQME